MIIYGKKNFDELVNVLSEVANMGLAITLFWILPIYKVEIKYNPIKE